MLTRGARLLRPDEEDFYEFYLTLTRDAPSPPAIAARLFAFHPGSRLWIADHPKGQNTVTGEAGRRSALRGHRHRRSRTTG
jgi:hypothetical protein